MIGAIQQATRPEAIALPGVEKPSGGVFGELLQQAIASVGRYEARSQQAVDRFLSGEDEEIHRVAAAAQQAEIAFQLFMGVRNKVVEAYQEVMRMPV